MTQQLQITKVRTLKEKPEVAGIFGSYFTDHMFSMDYSAELGWHSKQLFLTHLRISPSARTALQPSSFEGLKHIMLTEKSHVPS